MEKSKKILLLLLFWAGDSENWYPLNAVAYLGRERSGSSRSVGIATEKTMELCKPYYNMNRNINFDNFFTSYELSQQLRSNKLTCVGTVRKIKKNHPTGIFGSPPTSNWL